MNTALKYIFRLVLSVMIIAVLSDAAFAQKAIAGKEKEHYERLNIFSDSIQVREDGMRTTGKRGTYEWWYFGKRQKNILPGFLLCHREKYQP